MSSQEPVESLVQTQTGSPGPDTLTQESTNGNGDLASPPPDHFSTQFEESVGQAPPPAPTPVREWQSYKHPAENVPSGWDRARQSYAEGSTLDLRVVGYNRGGLLVDLGDVRGFVPASQLVKFPRRITEDERMTELALFMGKTLHLKVIELDRSRNRLILSERLANIPAIRTENMINTIEPGQSLRGTIRNVTDFGAFVDLGGVEGLIHVSEMSWQRVKHPRDICTPGTDVDVYVIDVNRQQRRIGLSLKRLRPDPWALVAEHYNVGDIADAVITNVVSFGAFARLVEGVEGLIHASELAEGSFLHPRDVVQEGQPVKVRIMSIEPQRQRVGLTMRLDEDPNRRGTPMPPGPSVPDAGYWDSLARES